MRYRRLGDTGLMVSEIGFGTIPVLSGEVPVLPAYYSPDEELAVQIMTCAWKLGCNLYDTAIVPEYGDAEIKLGKFAERIGTFEQASLAMGKEPVVGNRPDFDAVICHLEKDFEPIPCDRCQRCRCPYGTEIHIVFRQYNYYFLGKNYWALRKLDLGIRESAEFCEKCVEMPCLSQCPKAIDIPGWMYRVRELTEVHIRNSII